MSRDESRKTRLQHRRGPKPAALPPEPAAGSAVEGLMFGGFSLDRSDRHLRNYHRFDPESEADDLYFRLTRALVVAARRWRKIANDRLRPLEQTMQQWETLYLVAYSDEELNQSQLSRLLGVHGPTMLRMLDALARRGLIERQQSHHDLRVTINRITPAGREVISSIMGITNALRRELLAQIDPEDLRTTGRVLAQVLGALDRIDQDTRPQPSADPPA
ncbi:MAG TPA: MarR family transcriptional regulator [Croceibacterium sp.]